MRVMMVPIVIGALKTVCKGLEREVEELRIGGRIAKLQTASLVRTTKKMRKVLETWGDLLSLRLQRKVIS